MRTALKSIIEEIPGASLTGGEGVTITGIEYDSRRVKPGMLFVAISGYKADGRRFIDDAVARGAVAILTDTPLTAKAAVILVESPRRTLADIAALFYGYPGMRLTVAGSTGTNGKSTTIFLVKKMLEVAGHKAGMMNSLVYDTGAKQYNAERTTPESLDVQRLLYEMLEAGCNYAVVEVSSHALVLNRVENIDFKVGLFTSFSRDHLDFHKTMGDYLAAKKLFLKKLEGENKTAIINKDIPEFESFIRDAGCRVVTYSANGSKADVSIKSARLSADKTVFELTTPEGERRIEMKLLGRYNLSNAAGAAAAGLALGIDLGHVGKALEEAEPVPGRFRPIDVGQPFTVLIDYAHTPDAIERLCQSAREISKGRVLLLFGCGGDRDKGKRPMMGQVASRNADFVVVTSDNPRTEDPNKIIEEIMPGMEKDSYVVIPERDKAISEIIERAEKNDMVLIAGKGAEDYQEIGTTKYPFSDTEEIVKALHERGYEKARKR